MGKRRLTLIRITMPTTISFRTPCLKSEMFIMKSKFKFYYRGKSAIHPNVVIKYVATLPNILCVVKNMVKLNAVETLNGARENPNDSWQDRDETTRVELRPHNLFTWEYRGDTTIGKGLPFRNNHRIEMESKPSFFSASSSLLALKSHHDTPPLFDYYS